LDKKLKKEKIRKKSKIKDGNVVVIRRKNNSKAQELKIVKKKNLLLFANYFLGLNWKNMTGLF
jgi:hypothetical protein